MYRFCSHCCIMVPYGSLVKLIDHRDRSFAFVYNEMWFGYYDFSLFKPYFVERKPIITHLKQSI